jgi:hypothetical protein
MPMLFPSRGFRRTRERASGLLFTFGVDDLSTSLVTGQTITATRASGRTVFDTQGRVATITHSQIPWSGVYNTTAATWEPTLDVQPAATNLCLQSENFGTTWAVIGTPTRTAASKYVGDVALDLLGDDAAGTLEGYSQVVTYTADAVKALSVFMAAGTSTGCVVRLRDTTASANRLLATITWSAGVPTVTMTTGTHLGTTICAGGAYQFLFQATSVTAANTNQIEVYPATTSALVTTNTGTVYVGGVQTQNASVPYAYAKTTTATVTTSADVVTAGLNWTPQDFTVYARVHRVPWLSATGSIVAGVAGGNNTGARWAMTLISGTTPQLWATLHDGTTAATQTANLTAGDVLDFAVKYTGVQTGGTVYLDVGSGYGAGISGPAGISAWAGTTMALGAIDAVGNSPLTGGLRRLIIAPGARTLSQMRGLAV